MSSENAVPNDKVDAILEQWRSVRPDMDCSAMGIVGRLGRAHGLWKPQLDQVFQLFDLSPVEFDILATIRRNNTEITPTELYQTLMFSSGRRSARALSSWCNAALYSVSRAIKTDAAVR